MFVVDEKCVHISLFPLSLSIRSILLAWLIRAPFHRHAGNTFAQYRVGRACPFLRRYPHLADFENAKKSIEVEEGTKNLIFHLLERSFFNTDRRRRRFILSRFPFRFNPWSSTGRRKLRDRNSEARVVEVVFEFKVGGFYFFNCLLLFFLFFERREWLVRREGRRGVPFAGTSNKLDNRSAMFVYPYVCAVALRV